MWHIWDMPAGWGIIRLSGKIGSERPTVRAALLNSAWLAALHLLRSPSRFATTALHCSFLPILETRQLHQYGQLDEDKLFEFAHSLKLEETTVALSILCTLPVDVAERALVDKSREAILVLARALDLSWPTTMALLFLGATNYRIITSDLDMMKGEFFRLNVDTSRRVLKTYQSRKEANIDDSSFGHLPQLHSR